MNLLKSSFLILLMILAGCSSKGEKPTAAAPLEPVIDHAWLDDYEPRLRDALKESSFEVERRKGLLVVTAPVDASFNPDRPGMLLPVTLGPISRVAKLVENDEKTAVVVLGHADSTGSVEINRTISRQRAGAVAAIFRLSGLKHDRLRIRGMGSDMPRASNEHEEGRALNRRVEMMLAPQATLLALISQYNTPPTQVAAAEVSKKAE
ncbi:MULTISPECIES: OmpA family protein [Pseudomonadaceae]|uniref:Putative outer membrane protein n=1 Tax=Pseudomonas saudiphocaensis TaxID=1499686 RepID=A0A078LWF8_9PSED|nr:MULTISPECIES: OmpA family protein [Pseudomonadaceae]MBE7927066.1 OmpA family protein [Pseudomonas saudiphocaensis]MCF6782921.1 OmpA family protein [Stutzerimonas stutzeri]MCF6804032.1 OmpA family protein [Stutzerimonas stutzeri]CDZ94201.1 putative outer membrane protein [Pseudomonas saudiphocaensis]